MRFEKTQEIDGSVEEVEQAMLHEGYGAFLLQHHGVLLEVQQLERREDGDKVHRKVRYRPRPVIASVGPRKIPAEWFAFVESSTWDRSRKELTFTNVPTSGSISKMLVNSGKLRLRARGGRTERTMDGEIKLNVPFFLKPLALIAEKMIQHEGLKLLDAELPVINRYIKEVIRK